MRLVERGKGIHCEGITLATFAGVRSVPVHCCTLYIVVKGQYFVLLPLCTLESKEMGHDVVVANCTWRQRTRGRRPSELSQPRTFTIHSTGMRLYRGNPKCPGTAAEDGSHKRPARLVMSASTDRATNAHTSATWISASLSPSGLEFNSHKLCLSFCAEQSQLAWL